MKGIFNLRPPIPRYSFTWDVAKVLNYLGSLHPLQDLSMKLLTLKTVALLALATAQRAQTLANLKLNLIQRTGNSLNFRIDSLLKTSRPKHLNNEISVSSYHKAQVCPVKTLVYYISKTKNLRKANKLFVSFKTYKAVKSCTISRWLKLVLHLSGIDTEKFKGHSYRAAASSKARKAGMSVNEIMKTANWSSANTFRKYYHKDVEDNLQNNISTRFVNLVFDTPLQPDGLDG